MRNDLVCRRRSPFLEPLKHRTNEVYVVSPIAQRAVIDARGSVELHKLICGSLPTRCSHDRVVVVDSVVRRDQPICHPMPQQ
ncbi:hypothetical protein D3C72_2229100 [compost metagenome]